MAQTWSNLEIIIVNDGSTDPATIAILPSFESARCRVLHRENGGLPVARNTGIAAASGKYVLCLDADDMVDATFVEKAVPLLEANADLGLVTSAGVYFGDRSGPLGRLDPTPENILLGKAMLSFMIFRKGDWARTSGFDPALSLLEDMDFWLSILGLNKTFHCLSEPLFKYRRHESSMTSQFRNKKAVKRNVVVENAPRLYIFKKHQDVYLRYPEMIVRQLFGESSNDKIKYSAFKRLKYKLIVRAARLPVLSSLLARQAEKAANRLEWL